jgi:hypothetical protein
MAALKSSRQDAVNVPQTGRITFSNCAKYTGSPVPLRRLAKGVGRA